MKILFYLASFFLFCQCSLIPISKPSSQLEGRSTQTCADPNDAIPIWEGYDPNRVGHALGEHFAFVHDKTLALLGESFLAWPTQEVGTVPLYQLFNAASQDWLFLPPGPGGALPSSPGYVVQQITTYVYPTQICDSVPLFMVFTTNPVDRYYTTETREVDSMQPLGWQSGGVVAYVLPLVYKND